MWSKRDKLYLDWIDKGARSKTYSQQTQAMAVLAKIVPSRNLDKLIKLTLNPPEDMTKIMTPYFMFYWLDALYDNKQENAALDMIRTKWAMMLDEGATTWWEHFHTEHSLCHAWSSGPAYFLSRNILGVSQLKPAYDKVLIRPCVADLYWAEGIVPTIKGDIIINWRLDQQKKIFLLNYTLPNTLSCKLELPILNSFSQMREFNIWFNGKQIKNIKINDNYVHLDLMPHCKGRILMEYCI